MLNFKCKRLANYNEKTKYVHLHFTLCTKLFHYKSSSLYSLVVRSTASSFILFIFLTGVDFIIVTAFYTAFDLLYRSSSSSESRRRLGVKSGFSRLAFPTTSFLPQFIVISFNLHALIALKFANIWFPIFVLRVLWVIFTASFMLPSPWN